MSQNPTVKTMRGGLILAAIGIFVMVITNGAPLLMFLGLAAATVGAIIALIGLAAWGKQRASVR